MSALPTFVPGRRSHVASPTQRWSPVTFLARQLARIRSLTNRGRRRAKPTPAGAAPASDGQILAFAELCRMLERPFALAEIRAAAPAADGALGVGGILLAAERLGFNPDFSQRVGASGLWIGDNSSVTKS